MRITLAAGGGWQGGFVTSSVRIGVIGVGSMGSAMLSRMVATGHDVAFTARRAEVRAEVEALGARSYDSVATLASEVDAVVVCVYSDEQVREVCLGPEGVLAALRPGGTVVVHTTCSPDTPPLLAEVGAARGVQVLDVAFSGGPADAESGGITLLVGGDDDVLAQARPWLSSYGGPLLHVGVLGDAQRVKLVNNALFGASVALVLEAERVARDLGLDPALALAAIAECSGNSYALRLARRPGGAAALRQSAGKYIDKDVATAQALAQAAGTDLGLLGTVAGTTAAATTSSTTARRRQDHEEPA
jgi:3-hydroxyisobutyrate dehydrogenase-like beta-hydroxyacid dehydrogenase